MLALRSKDLETIRATLTSLMGVGRKVADCVALFSMDKPECIPVDTHVFQIAKRFKFIPAQDKLTEATYK
jgi:N-glycosylase/DNA lyase